MLTQERLHEVLDYDPESGIFTWMVKKSKCLHVGDRAGCLDRSSGYRRLRIDKTNYGEHSLAFLYMTGDWPNGEVHHDNEKKDDNRWVNLFDATRGENTHSRGKLSNNKSGAKGVCWRGDRWRVQLYFNKKRVFVGYFATKEEAAAAYKEVAIIYYGKFAKF